jgi:hypothetical protein
MARLFEFRVRGPKSEAQGAVDLDKVCTVRVERASGAQLPSIVVRFVDGREVKDIVPPEDAQRFIDAFRAHLAGRQ